jgi:peptide chain release factor 1
VPPNDKHGRVQTSTVTVATLDPEVPVAFELRESEVDIQKTKGSGPGGQARNKLETCVVVTHRATGLSVRVDMRSQHQSKAMAMRILAARLRERAVTSAADERGAIRRAQVGSGMRGDKIRTYRTQDDRVTDHRTNRTSSLAQWMRGDWS